MAKTRRRRRISRPLGDLFGKPPNMTVAWIPIGLNDRKGAGRPGRWRKLAGWKQVTVTDNVIDLKGMGKADTLVVRNIAIRIIGRTLYIEGRTLEPGPIWKIKRPKKKTAGR